MRTIFDPGDKWIGRSPFQRALGNKRPVAIDDVLTVPKNSGPITVDVLANDFDPEGGALTLLSATAALGTATAEADGTVTYTPPAGVSGFDSVVYDIADPEGRTRSGQIDVTIAEPTLTVNTTPENRLTVTAEALSIDITVDAPAAFSGTYAADIADLTGGPVNLTPPSISGTPDAGNVLNATQGLWIHDTGIGTPTASWQWQRAGADITGATGQSYTVQAADVGQGLSVRQTVSDAAGQRSAVSGTVGAAFTPADDAALLGWWDAADLGTITETSGTLNGWTDKSGAGTVLNSTGIRQPKTGTRTLGGLNVIDFDGTQFLDEIVSLPVSGDVAFHMAFVLDAADNGFEAVLAVDATNDFQIDAKSASGFDGRLNVAGIGSSVDLTGGPFSGALILSAVFDRTGAGQAEVFVSNVSRGVAAYTASIDSAVLLILMSNRSRNSWIDGAVAEVIITGDVSNRASHHAYLSDKWGIS